MLRIALAAITCSLPAALNGADSTRPTCALTIELVDSQSGEFLPGVVQVRDGAGQLVELPTLVKRGQGIEGEGPIHDWSVLARPATVEVPAEALEIRAFSGLETEQASQRLDLSGTRRSSLRVPLRRFARARQRGYLAGNTHLHLKRLSKAEADRYLTEVPLADGLDVVFLSYLERAVEDLEYTSNKYTLHDLARLSHGHLHFGHGEEHRHNFDTHGEGYGHILLLDIPYLVHPVSIGPGITRAGPDFPPMRQGIDAARGAGGKVIWAHNLYGFEDIPNWVTGRVDANNIFDGSKRGSYKDTYYRYLNIGLRVPFSTGTDWFIYDFSRAYVISDKPTTPKEWLDRLAAGKSYISNGPLLEFTVEGRQLGDVIELKEPKTLTVRGRAVGRADFKRIELMQNGAVVAKSEARRRDGHFEAALDATLAIDRPSWMALRTVPPPVADEPELREPVGTNEFGGELFAHTSPIYVRLAGREVFDAEVARGLRDEMKAAIEKIKSQAVFDNDEQRHRVLHIYEDAIESLDQRLANTAKRRDSIDRQPKSQP